MPHAEQLRQDAGEPQPGPGARQQYRQGDEDQLLPAATALAFRFDLRAAGAVGALEPLPVVAASAYDATFEARGAEARSALTVALDGGVVTSCRLVVSGDEWPTESRTELTERIEETL